MNKLPLLCQVTSMIVAFGLMTACKDKNVVAEPEKVIGEKFTGDTLRGSIKGTIAGREKPYYMTSDVTVNEGDTLWIQEGVKVTVVGDPNSPATFGQATNSPMFIIKGVLLSLGTKDKPIRFSIADNLKSPATVTDQATDPAFKGYWGGFNCDNANMVIFKWSSVEYVGGPWGTNAPTGYVAGDPRPGISFLAKKQNSVFIVEDSKFYGSTDDMIRTQSLPIFSITRSRFEKTGKNAAEAINLKAGTIGDVSYNVFIGSATNAIKVASLVGAPVQTNANIFNNTIVNSGYRQTKSGRGGSINFEAGAKGMVYNNLIANCRFGLRMRSDLLPDTANIKYGNTMYYGHTAHHATQFNADSAGSVTRSRGTDIRGAAGTNDPLFTSFNLALTAGTSAAPSPTAMRTNFFLSTDNLRLKSGSPALGKGFTNFTAINSIRNIQNVSGIFTPTVTPIGKDIGCYQADGTGNPQ